MVGRTRGYGGGNWRRALALSLALHAAGLLAIAIGASATRARFADRPLAAGDVTAAVEIPTLVDLAAFESLPALEVVPDLAHARLPDPLAGPAIPADQSHAAPTRAAFAIAGGADRRTPAPDRGAGLGRAVEDPAWRRDASTLHERLSDGAEKYQPAHTRTASRAASPQAVRREPRTGPGDSVQTRRAQRAPAAASYGVAEPELPGPGSAMSEGVAAVMPSVAPDPALPEARRTILASQGPLEVEQGIQSFDVDSPKLVAADDRVARAASREDHPGITDLTLAAVSGNSAAGRGPSDTPGAVDRATTGPSPSRAGAPRAPGVAGDDQRTEERRYDRYKQEIGYRVNRERVFPRALALRLEQGETLLRFVVLPDGNLGNGIQVVKSSGFAEFDQAAVDAVRRASPFGPMPDPARAKSLPVKLLVAFPNPVIR